MTLQSRERLDVADVNDRVIGTATRGEIHRDNLMHRAVHLLVCNAAGEVFLQKRSMSKDNNPGLWDSSVSGHVDAGESYDACVVREAREEIGLSLDAVPARLFKLKACRETGFEHTWVYGCRAEGPFELDPVEIDEGRWLPPADVDRWFAGRPGDFAETMHQIWPVFRRGA